MKIISQEELFEKIDADSASMKTAVMDNMHLVLSCNALAKKLSDAGLAVSPVVSIHRDSINTWVQCHDSESAILETLAKCEIRIISAAPCAGFTDEYLKFDLESYPVPLIAPNASNRAKEAA